MNAQGLESHLVLNLYTDLFKLLLFEFHRFIFELSSEEDNILDITI